MIKALNLLVAGAVALAPFTALAEDTVAPAKPLDPSQRVVCRTENEIGSRLHKIKTCKTVAEWRDAASDAANLFEKHNALVAKGGGG